MTGTVIVEAGERADADADADRDGHASTPTATPTSPTVAPRRRASSRRTTTTPDGQELVPGRVEQRRGGQLGHGRTRARPWTSATRRARTSHNVGVRDQADVLRAEDRHRDPARRRRCRRSRCPPGWTRRVHVRHAGRLHVRVHGAPTEMTGSVVVGDGGTSRRRRRRRRRPRPRRPTPSRRATRCRRRCRSRGRRSTSPRMKAMTVASFLANKLKIVVALRLGRLRHADADGRQGGRQADRPRSGTQARLGRRDLQRARPLHGQGQTERRRPETALGGLQGIGEGDAPRSRWPARSARRRATRTITSRARGAR